MTSIPHFVYELVDPRDNTIFYVGITANLYARFKQHMHCDGTNVQKQQKVQEILVSGHLPIMRTIERIESFEQALQREDYWIRHYVATGITLLNAEVTWSSNGGKTGGGRQSNYEQVKAVILYRYLHKKYPPTISNDMQRRYEFNYFTKPTRTEKASDTKRAARHVRAYQRGRQWITEVELVSE